MLNRFCQRAIIIMAAGLWFTGYSGLSLAGEADISAKSKALAHYMMGVVQDLNGDDQHAIMEYEKSAKYDRHQPMSHLKLAAYYARMGKVNEAISQLKTVIKLQSDIPQAHYLLALIYSSQKKYELAADQYEAILKISSPNSSDNTDVHAYLAQLYFALQKNSQALNQLNQVLQFQPNNVSALYLQGNIYMELNQKDEAKANFRKILGIEPNHDEVLNSLAYMYAEEGVNLDEALKMARKAVSLDPSNGAYYDTLGWVLYKEGFNAESLMALEKAQKYVKDSIVYEHIGDVYKAENEETLARKFWLKALALDPKQVEISEKLEKLNKITASNPSMKDTPTK